MQPQRTTFLHRSLIGFLILTLLGAQFCLFALGHIHLDENGNTVYHAHATDRSGAAHSHSHSDMAALSHVLLTLTVLLLALCLLWLTHTQSLSIPIYHLRTPDPRLWRYAISHRGPPLAPALR